MEYVYDHGPFADLPYDMIMAAFRKHYPIYFIKENTTPPRGFRGRDPEGKKAACLNSEGRGYADATLCPDTC